MYFTFSFEFKTVRWDYELSVSAKALCYLFIILNNMWKVQFLFYHRMGITVKAALKKEFNFIFLFTLFILAITLSCFLAGYLISWTYLSVILFSIYWHFTSDPDPSPDQIHKRKDTLVVIIGSGYSGLCAAVRLKKERIRFILLEKSSNIGGTWWDNIYPGKC